MLKANRLHVYLIFLCGIVFIVSSFLKILDFQSFAFQVSSYGVIRQVDIVRWTALGIVGLEMALGVSLFLQLGLKRVILPLTMLLLLVFTGLIAYGWKYQGLQDCGCFGTYIKMSPLASIYKNLFLLIILGYSYHKLLKTPNTDEKSLIPLSLPFKIILVILFTFAGLSYIGFSQPHTFSIQTDKKDRPFAEFQVIDQGRPMDLGTGIYFVAMLSTTCPHCAKSVADLNELAKMEDFPKVIGLCMGDETTLMDFRNKTHPLFPTALIDKLKFMQFINKKPPRFMLVQDGKYYQYWDNEVPPVMQILEAMSKLPRLSLDTEKS